MWRLAACMWQHEVVCRCQTVVITEHAAGGVVAALGALQHWAAPAFTCAAGACLYVGAGCRIVVLPVYLAFVHGYIFMYKQGLCCLRLLRHATVKGGGFCCTSRRLRSGNLPTVVIVPLQSSLTCVAAALATATHVCGSTAPHARGEPLHLKIFIVVYFFISAAAQQSWTVCVCGCIWPGRMGLAISWDERKAGWPDGLG